MLSMRQLLSPAYRWRRGELDKVVLSEKIENMQLLGLDEQLALINKNMEFFLKRKRALNILLWGEKGSGKSTIVRLLARDYAAKGARIIEFRDDDYYSIYSLYEIIRIHTDLFFLLYFDDVSFDNDDERYRNFKSIVEGGLEECPVNALFIATSNRRHLIAEKAHDTQDIYNRDDENERSSLFARFGLSVGFYPLEKSLYLEIAAHYLDGKKFEGWEESAENFALERGGRSGRVAQQFAIYHKILGG